MVPWYIRRQGKIKANQLLLLCLIVCSIWNSTQGKAHRLIPENTLDIGNQWEYQMHITRWPGSGSVNWWGTATREIITNENVAGYDTVRSYAVITCPQTGTSWSTSNDYLTPEYVVEVRTENEGEIYTVRDNDPFEQTPVWANESDNNRHVGHGKYLGQLKDPYFTWDGYQDSYITFLRTESITVPAGTFNCVVVFLREEFHDFAGIWGYDECTIWSNPLVGEIKCEEYFWMWDPFELQAIVTEGVFELTSTNVTYMQDFDEDFDVDSADLHIFTLAWLTENGDFGWNSDCDIYTDGFIDILDFAEFAKNWRADVK